ncbi:MAG: response regulator [Clostridiales bacterium]|nr:response regulator [Clostridiales bacterium]
MGTVLIVDDSRTSRKILEAILIEGGLEVIGQAADGQQGVDLYQELKPDVVTMDITMPVMDGVEALAKIKEIDPKAKVVMVTAAGQKSKIIDALKLGVDDFLTKPYESEEIVSTIMRVIDK